MVNMTSGNEKTEPCSKCSGGEVGRQGGIMRRPFVRSCWLHPLAGATRFDPVASRYEQPSLRDAKDGGKGGKLSCAHTHEDVEEGSCGTTRSLHDKVKFVPPTSPN